MGKSKRTRVRKTPYGEEDSMEVLGRKGANKHFNIQDILDPGTEEIDITKLFDNMSSISDDALSEANTLGALSKLHRIEMKEFLKRKNELKEIMYGRVFVLYKSLYFVFTGTKN